jgi:hypothetical protein
MGRKAHEPTSEEVGRLRAYMRLMGLRPALAKMGIPIRTGNRWRKRGQMDHERGRKNGFVDWHLVIEESFADKQARAESLVHRANDPTQFEDLPIRDRLAHARWTVKCLDPATYGDRTEVQIRGEIEGICESLRPHMSASAYAEMISAFATVANVDLGASDGDDGEDALPLH